MNFNVACWFPGKKKRHQAEANIRDQCCKKAENRAAQSTVNAARRDSGPFPAPREPVILHDLPKGTHARFLIGFVLVGLVVGAMGGCSASAAGCWSILLGLPLLFPAQGRGRPTWPCCSAHRHLASSLLAGGTVNLRAACSSAGFAAADTLVDGFGNSSTVSERFSA